MSSTKWTSVPKNWKTLSASVPPVLAWYINWLSKHTGLTRSAVVRVLLRDQLIELTKMWPEESEARQQLLPELEAIKDNGWVE